MVFGFIFSEVLLRWSCLYLSWLSSKHFTQVGFYLRIIKHWSSECRGDDGAPECPAEIVFNKL